MFEERAILLGKLGRHEQALSIYTNILKDMPAAIDYCNICYQSDSPANKEVSSIKSIFRSRIKKKIQLSKYQVYFYYLKLLLHPNEAVKVPGLAYPTEEPQQPEPDIKKALETLDRFPSRIDPIKVKMIA